MPKRKRYDWIGLVSALFLAACASTPGSAGTGGGTLNAAALDNLGPGVTAYEAIERLRPTWLRDRGINSTTAFDDTLPRVHIDSTPYSIDALRSFRTSDVESISFMDGRDATTRYGTGYVNGLIVVTTRTGPRVPGS